MTMIINPQRLQVQRLTDLAWIEGRPVATPVTISIVAGVRPFGLNEIELLPEGVDLEDSIWIVTRSQLKTADVKKQTAADVVRYEGELFAIHRATLCPPPLRHYECIGVRIDPDATREVEP